MPCRPRSADSFSDYNIFGYDPEGRLAHIVAHFYGPAWRPQSLTHLRRFEGEVVGPPRYGPPAPHQIPWLSSDYTPQLPPTYHGVPKPPYLPAPIIFDPGCFEAMLYHGVRAPLRCTEADELLSNGFPAGEVAYRVWNIRVQYIQESRNREFGILSNAPWDDFYSTACSHLAVDPQKAQLAFYMSGEGYYSGLVSLKGEQEWENAMQTFIRAARQDRGMEFEILDVNGARIKDPKHAPSSADGNPFGEHAFHLLSSHNMNCRTYAFEYPKLEMLLDALHPTVLLDAEERAMLYMLRMEYADDFMLISPLNLCLATGVLPEKVLFLYSWAERMISILHEEKRDTIEEMEGMRKEWGLMRGRDVEDNDQDMPI